jgi:TPR repeat protein
MHATGQGVPQDDKRAAQWWRKAAEQGEANGQSNLGILYANGQGVPQDYKRAAEWYRKAC